MSTTRDIGPSRPRTRPPSPRAAPPSHPRTPLVPLGDSDGLSWWSTHHHDPARTPPPTLGASERGPIGRDAGWSDACTPAVGRGCLRPIARRRPRPDTGAIECRHPGDREQTSGRSGRPCACPSTPREAPTGARGGRQRTTSPRGALRARSEPPNGFSSGGRARTLVRSQPARPAVGRGRLCDRTRAPRRSGATCDRTQAIERGYPGDQGARARVRRYRGRLRRVVVVVARGPRARGELSEHVRSLRTGARPGAQQFGGAGRRRAGPGTAKARTPGGAGLRARRPGGQVRVRARPPERVT